MFMLRRPLNLVRPWACSARALHCQRFQRAATSPAAAAYRARASGWRAAGNLPRAFSSTNFPSDKRGGDPDNIYVNIEEYKEYSKLNLLDFYLIEENNSLEVIPIGSQYNIDIPNDHLQYAFTWFSLAIVLCVFMHLIWKKYD